MTAAGTTSTDSSHPPAGGWDEMRCPDGRVRAHWTAALHEVEDLGPDEMGRRRDQIRRQLREHGVRDLRGSDATPEAVRALDPLPLLLPPDEWRALAEGLAQRAHVLDRWCADCYGQQRALRDGAVPAELVLGDPAFLRACHGMALPGERWLHLVAFDCLRGPDGSWYVLRDHTTAALGLGLALENRIVLTRAIPELVRSQPVERLAGFFATFRDGLRALAPAHRDPPRIVLLTAGSTDPAWAEQAYLARYLGFGLVESGDLTVRERAVFLKTLGGLERVDVVLRWLDDAACDPLSLGSDPQSGVPGLVQAAKAGRVAVANALGSGIAEGPGLAPHLPALCRRLVGAELLLPTAAADVLPSTAPCWTPDGIASAPVTLRAWAAATADGTYRVMPGALVRVLEASGPGATKDAWVLADGPVDPLSLLPAPGQPVPLTRGGTELPSRVADDLFWLGRHVERAEGIARLLRTTLRRLADEPDVAGRGILRRLGDALVAIAEVSTSSVRLDGGEADERVLTSFLASDTPAGALRPTVAAAWRLGARVRDEISLDTWRVLQRLERQLPGLDTGEPPPLAVALDALDGLVQTLAAYSGLGVENLTRGLGWRFADIGRRIERARATALLLRTTVAREDGDEGPLLASVLEATDVSMTYRRRYLAPAQLMPALDLVLLDETSPRSVAFQLAALEAHVARLPRDPRRATRSSEERLALAALTRVRLADLGALCVRGEGGRRAWLDGLCESLASDLAALSDALTHAYLSHADVPLPLGIPG